MKKKLFLIYGLVLTLMFGMISCDKSDNNQSANSTISTEDENTSTDKSMQNTGLFPVYDGGIAAKELYDCGGGKDMGRTSQAQMQVISDTSREDFDAYLAKLKKSGFDEVARNTEYENLYVQYYNKTSNQLVYTYFLDKLKETRIIQDNASALETDFEYTCEDGDVTVYQYAIMQDGQSEIFDGWYEMNGMFYIIRLPDNRLICVDGATAYRQATKKSIAELWDFMQEITGKDTIDIACWYITHPHVDHYGFLYHLLRDKKAENINVERIMYNFNNPDLIPDTDATELGSMIAQKFSDTLYIKPHTGQKITLGNIDIDVLITHEDYVDPTTGKTIITDANNTSPIIRLHINGKTFLLAGDWSGPGGATAPPEYKEGISRLLAMHTNKDTESNLKSDIFQIPHHGFNTYIEELTDAVAAEYAFLPAPDAALETRRNIEPSWNVRRFVRAGGDYERVYFTSRYTYALCITTNGDIVVAAEPIRGVDTGDDPETTQVVEEDYMNVTLKRRGPFRIPTDEEFENWDKIHK